MWNPLKKWSPFGKKKELEDEIPEFGEEITEEADLSLKEEIEPDYQEEIPEELKEEFNPVEDKLTLTLKKTVRGLMLALVALMSVFFLPFTAPADVLSASKQLLLFGLVFISLVLWLIIIVRQGGMVLRKSGLELGIAIFLAGWLLASVFSTSVANSFLSGAGFITWACLAGMVFVILNFFEKKESPRLANYFILGSFVSALAGLLDIFGLSVFGWMVILMKKGLAINPGFNTVGSLYSLGAAAALALLVTASQYILGGLKFKNSESGETEDETVKGWLGKFWASVRVGMIIVSAVLLLILNWWVLYLILAVGMLAIALAPAMIEKVSGRKLQLRAANIITPLVVLGIAGLMLVGGKFVNIPFPNKDKIAPDIQLSQSVTGEIAQGVFNYKPFFGYGPENFQIAYDNLRPKELNATSFWSVRFYNGASELLNLGIMGGIAAIAGLLGLLYFVFFRLPKKQSSDDSADARQKIFLWVSMPVFIASIVLMGFYSYNITLYFILWFGLAMLALSSGRRDEIKIAINSASMRAILVSLAAVVVIAVGLTGGYFVVQKYSAEAYFASAARLDLTQKGAIDSAINYLQKAENSSHSDPKYLTGLGTVLISRINSDVKNKTDKREDVAKRLKNSVGGAVSAANTLIKTYPNDSSAWLAAAGVYQNLISLVDGADDAAVNAYREYQKRAPTDANGYLQEGTIHLNRADNNNLALAEAKQKKLVVKNEKEVVDKIIKDYNDAERNLKKVVDLKPDTAAAYYYLGIVYERENRIGDAVKQIEKLANANLNNPSLAFELGLLYYRNNQKDQAFQEMARAVSLFSGYSNARWYLALMLEEKGKMDLAIAQLQEILKIDANKDNQVVLDKIASLQAGKREIPPAKVTSKKPL